MTQTKIDPTKANIEELRRWLASQASEQRRQVIEPRL